MPNRKKSRKLPRQRRKPRHFNRMILPVLGLAVSSLVIGYAFISIRHTRTVNHPGAAGQLSGAVTAKEAAVLPLYVDARPLGAYLSGHIPGAVSISGSGGLSELKNRARILPQNRHLVVYDFGYNCIPAENIKKVLAGMGITDVEVFRGGWREWMASGNPVEKGESQ